MERFPFYHIFPSTVAVTHVQYQQSLVRSKYAQPPTKAHASATALINQALAHRRALLSRTPKQCYSVRSFIASYKAAVTTEGYDDLLQREIH